VNSLTLNADPLNKAPGQFAEMFSRPRYSFYALALVFGLIIHVVGCKKSNQPTALPPITDEGKNTFGFMMYGSLWVPYVPCSYFGYPSWQLSYDTRPVDSSRALPIFFRLTARNESATAYFNIETYYPFFVSQTGNIIDSLLISYGEYQCYLRRGSPHYFNITKLDTVNKVVAGEFAFLMYTFNLNDSLLVTHGRFDFQMKSFISCSHQ
jgi:hypothetical protein